MRFLPVQGGRGGDYSPPCIHCFYHNIAAKNVKLLFDSALGIADNPVGLSAYPSELYLFKFINEISKVIGEGP
jgi:hypothetical protein